MKTLLVIASPFYRTPQVFRRGWSQLICLFVFLLLASLCRVHAYTNNFNDAASVSGWAHWWGGAMESVTWNTGFDANNDPNSGSMQVTVPFNRSLSDNQFSMWLSFSGTPNSWTARRDGTQYDLLEMDIYWDAFSPTIPSSGRYSSDFHYGFAVGDPVYGQIDFNNHVNIEHSEADKWIHLSMPINPATLGPNLTNIVGIWLKMWTGSDPNNSLENGDVTFWVDNIRLRSVPPPPPDYVQNFDSADALNGWVHWWGNATEMREFDATKDASGNPSSGSMKVTVPYNRSLGNENQFSMWGSFSGGPNTWTQPINGALYTNLEMDVYWDPASPIRPATGDYGNDFRYGFAVGAPLYSQISFNNHTTIAAAEVGQWIHLSAPIDLATISPNITNIVGVWLKMWTGNAPGQSLNDGNAVFWVDNIRLRSKASTVAPPPPKLSVEKRGPTGLRLYANSPGSQYQRQGIRAKNPAYSWVGAVEPVTYSLTIKDHPIFQHTNAGGFQTHLFLVADGSVAVTERSPDYVLPNVVFLDIHANMDGSAYASFRYKTNEPGGNAFLYGAGSIATVGSSTILGRWSLTFNPGGSINLTSPGGGMTNFMMPPDAVTLFAGPVFPYFGVQPNQTANIGLDATLSQVEITGVATPIHENFTTPDLDETLWEVVAENASGVIVVPEDALFWLTWTLPDAGYVLQVTAGLPASWTDLVIPAAQVGSMKRALVRQASLPADGSRGYFFRQRGQ